MSYANIIGDYSPTLVGEGYKVFRVNNGKLYPVMVANIGGVDTPLNVWIKAEEGEFGGYSKTGRPRVKQYKGNQTLSFRPGWHLGEIPRAIQFDRVNKESGEKEFPKDFVWAKCSYVKDINYQEESDDRGYIRTKINDKGEIEEYRSNKYQHSLAGLYHIPTDGFYIYRTNPNPQTPNWIICGAIRIDELLDDYQVNDILSSSGHAPIHRQGGDKTLKELGL